MFLSATKAAPDMQPPQETDFKPLMQAIAHHRDKTAFVRIFEHFAPRVKSWLLQQGLDEDTTEELVQATMITVWQKAALYKPEKAAVSTWIFTIARNKKIDFYRQEKRKEIDLDVLIPPQEAESPEHILQRVENSSKLQDAILELPPEQVEVLKKSFFEGKTHQKIAEEVDVPLGTIKSRLRLALHKLRIKLEKDV